MPDAAFRVYSLLLRFGGSSGNRTPSRGLLARRLHRSVDSIDRALRELVDHGLVRVEHRIAGRKSLSNRYHVRTSPPATRVPADRGRRSAGSPNVEHDLLGGAEGREVPSEYAAAMTSRSTRPLGWADCPAPSCMAGVGPEATPLSRGRKVVSEW